jgi:hypothetical protein
MVILWPIVPIGECHFQERKGGKHGKNPSIRKLVQHRRQLQLAIGVYEDYFNAEKGRAK